MTKAAMIFFYQTALSLFGSREGVGAYEHLGVWFPAQEHLGCVQEVQPGGATRTPSDFYD